MFGDIGWAELMVIGVVALIVIGPEDLPDMFRQIGRFTAKLRQMSREFSRAMEQAARESGVKDVADDLKTMTGPKSLGLSKVREAADRFEKWDPIKNAAKPTTPAAARPATSSPATSSPATADPATPEVPVLEPTIHGPATQALLDKDAARKAILAETRARLKALDAGMSEDGALAARPAAKPRAKKAAPPTTPDPAPAKKPRAPRKSTKADEA